MSDSTIMEVEGRDQLAAAIRAVPHDGPVQIILHRREKKPIVYKFDYTQSAVPGNLEYKHTLAGVHDRKNRNKTTNNIDARLERIAKAIRKTPKELWE